MRTRKVGGGNARKKTPARFFDVMTQTHNPQECNQLMKRDGNEDLEQGLGEDRVAYKSAKQCLECSVFP